MTYGTSSRVSSDWELLVTLIIPVQKIYNTKKNKDNIKQIKYIETICMYIELKGPRVFLPMSE